MIIRLVTSLFALALWASGASAAGAQGYPPSEGAPQSNNPYASSAANNTPNPALLAKAKNWFGQLQAGQIDREQMESGPNANLNDATISNAQRMIGDLGKPISFVQQRTGSQGGVTYAIYLVTFKNCEKVDFLFAVDHEGKVASLGLGSPK